MNTTTQSAYGTAPAGAVPANAALPDIVLRFTPLYAWMLIGFGVIFFFLGAVIAVQTQHHNRSIGIFIVLTSLATIFGANFWRHHLHVVAQLTLRQLILRRDGAVNWTDIAVINKREIRASYNGARGGSEFICIKLKTPRPQPAGLNGFLLKAKAAITGYDIIVGMAEMPCTADWFLTECQKRIATATA